MLKKIKNHVKKHKGTYVTIICGASGLVIGYVIGCKIYKAGCQHGVDTVHDALLNVDPELFIQVNEVFKQKEETVK